MEGLNGRDYRARVELTAKDQTVLAAPGETCDRVPPASLGWLLAQRLIEPVTVIPETVWADLGRAAEGVL